MGKGLSLDLRVRIYQEIAGGALALFVLTFVYTPNLVQDKAGKTVINQDSKGNYSPPITNNTGTIVIQCGEQTDK